MQTKKLHRDLERLYNYKWDTWRQAKDVFGLFLMFIYNHFLFYLSVKKIKIPYLCENMPFNEIKWKEIKRKRQRNEFHALKKVQIEQKPQFEYISGLLDDIYNGIWQCFGITKWHFPFYQYFQCKHHHVDVSQSYSWRSCNFDLIYTNNCCYVKRKCGKVYILIIKLSRQNDEISVIM